jgi:DNA-binding CsgD family transcriptional regulator
MRRLLAARHAGFLRDLDVFSEAEMLDDPFYRDLLYPRGLGWAAATAIPLPTGDSFAITVEREYRLGPVETTSVQTLDKLRPHLARAALLSARLQLDRARMASNTLAALGLAALVLNEHGKVLAANPLIEAMADFVVWRAHGGVSLTDRNADKLLREAIATTDAAVAGGTRSFPVRNAKSSAMMVAHVIPIRLSARDIFARCAAALVLTPVTLPQALPVELVQSLFDLTPAEARVARELASGLTVDGIAVAGGVSPNTIRTHVRSVLEKTGCNRQSEVVALLTGIWSPRQSDEG